MLAKVTGALGAARATAADVILPAVGIQLKVAVGQTIEAGKPWAELHHEGPVPEDSMAKLESAVTIRTADNGTVPSRILEIIS